MSKRSIAASKSLVAVALSLSLIALSPGFAAYEAAAQQVTGVSSRVQPGGVPTQAGAVRVAGGASSQLNTVSLSNLRLDAVLPAPGVYGAGVPLRSEREGGLPAGFTPGLKETPASVRVVAAGLPSAVAATVPASLQTSPLRFDAQPRAQAPVQGPEAAAAVQLDGMSGEVSEALKATGDIAKTQGESAHGLGIKLDAIITRTRQADAADQLLAPAAGRLGDLSGDSGAARLAAPEEGSARQASEPSLPETRPGQPPATKQPLAPRLIASALALLPAALLGWPLVAAGALYAGVGVMASSALLAALPFMGEGTPKYVHALPGAALLGLGGLTLAGAILGGGGLAVGILAALGGWGLIRYGTGKSVEDRSDNGAALSAYFGGIGAVTGAALVLSGATGLVATAFLVLSYPAAALLLMHLPSWVGMGITNVFTSAVKSLRGTSRVMAAAWNDTPLVDRLKKFSERYLEASKWNAVWLAGLWIPVWVLMAADWAGTLVVGLGLAAVQAPVMFLWGASHKISRESGPTKFFAAWAHFMFDNLQGAKKAFFNPVEKRLAGLAASKSKAVSLPATLGIYAASWLAAAASLLAAPLMLVAGLGVASTRVGQPYEREKHDPSSLRVSTDDSPGQQPQDPEEPGQPEPPVKSTIVPRLIASALGLLPAVFLGIPLYLAGPTVGWVYLAVTLSLAALPFVPAKTSKLIRMLPGALMIVLGVAVPYLTFSVGLPAFAALAAAAKTNAFWMAVVNVLGGWGLMRYLGRAAEDGKDFSMDSGERIGAYLGALAAVTGAGLILTASTGVFPTILTVAAYLTSPLLLMHLPKSIFTGLGAVFYRLWTSVGNSYRLLSSWSRDTKFYRNLQSHAEYWLERSVWNGAWLSVIWVPMWISQFVELVLGGALGLALGVIRAPLNFLWGLSYELAPASRITRFFSGMARTWESMVEGDSSQDFLKRYTKVFLDGMDDKSAGPSGRPTTKAAWSFAMYRFGQAFYLLKMAALLPVGLLTGAGFGVYNAIKGKPDRAADDPYRR
ncbi:MAG: hypothetical protein HY927_01770 [Elusimicrobia bacterium]|nr:hypothetical protein [Elusimicrobiota bacterium]